MAHEVALPWKILSPCRSLRVFITGSHFQRMLRILLPTTSPGLLKSLSHQLGVRLLKDGDQISGTTLLLARSSGLGTKRCSVSVY